MRLAVIGSVFVFSLLTAGCFIPNRGALQSYHVDLKGKGAEKQCYHVDQMGEGPVNLVREQHSYRNPEGKMLVDEDILYSIPSSTQPFAPRLAMIPGTGTCARERHYYKSAERKVLVDKDISYSTVPSTQPFSPRLKMIPQ